MFIAAQAIEKHAVAHAAFIAAQAIEKRSLFTTIRPNSFIAAQAIEKS